MSNAPRCPLCLCWHQPRCAAVPPGTRWPLAPLEALAGPALAAAFDHAAISRARRDGLSDLQADRWAIRCDIHPVLVWPEWGDTALRPLDRILVDGARHNDPTLTDHQETTCIAA